MSLPPILPSVSNKIIPHVASVALMWHLVVYASAHAQPLEKPLSNKEAAQALVNCLGNTIDTAWSAHIKPSMIEEYLSNKCTELKALSISEDKKYFLEKTKNEHTADLIAKATIDFLNKYYADRYTKEWALKRPSE